MALPREYERGPSPWVPAIVLGIIFFVATTPYMRTPDPAYTYRTARKAPGFPLPMLWIPVLAVIALQFFGGNRHYAYDSYGRPVVRTTPGGMYGGGPGGRYGDGMYPGGPGTYSSRGLGPAGYNRGGWGGWPWSAPSWNSYNRYTNPKEKGLGSLFMDIGGHWLLILLGIVLFMLVGSSSAPVAAALPPPRLSFPWSLFAPRGPQIVLPFM